MRDLDKIGKLELVKMLREIANSQMCQLTLRAASKIADWLKDDVAYNITSYLKKQERMKDILIDSFVGKYLHCPQGYVEETLQELQMCNDKNADYASEGDPFGNFNRVSKILSLYPDLKLSDPEVVALIYMLKQLDACFWMLNIGYEGQVEDVKARLRDVAVYSKLAMLLHKKK